MLLSRDEVEARIHEGQVLVIRHGGVLKLNKWLDRHPGGKMAILHMVGRDASDEMDAYHAVETLKSMDIYRIGHVELPWKGFVPPVQGGHFRSREEIAADLQERAWSAVPYSASQVNCDLTAAQAQLIDDRVAEELKFDTEKYPSTDLDTQCAIQSSYRTLHDELQREGWFKCTYWGYVREASRIVFLFMVSAILFRFRDRSNWYLALSAVALGFAWHQLTFIAHDAGHLAITHNYYIDNIVGILVADYIGGLSIGWWKQNHNVHHIVTNHPDHDPDIQHLPFFAVSERFLAGLYSTYYKKRLTNDAVAHLTLQAQHWLYYPILCLGRFNLYRLSWTYLLAGQGPRKGQAAWLRYVELAGLIFFTYWYFYVLCFKFLHTASQRWLFIMVSHIATMPVHVQITLSHFAQSTSDLGVNESFAQRQVRTTMDVACPAWLDYLHGGLQFQTIHHLFPRMPRHNFRAVQPRVIEFCEKLGLHYTIYGFVRGNKYVIDRLRDVAEQASIFNACNEFCRHEIVGGEAPKTAAARKRVRLEKEANYVSEHMAEVQPIIAS